MAKLKKLNLRKITLATSILSFALLLAIIAGLSLFVYDTLFRVSRPASEDANTNIQVEAVNPQLLEKVIRRLDDKTASPELEAAEIANPFEPPAPPPTAPPAPEVPPPAEGGNAPTETPPAPEVPPPAEGGNAPTETPPAPEVPPPTTNE